MRTLLVILDAIGDVIRATPVAEALRARGDDVTILANDRCLPVLEGLPFSLEENPRGRVREARGRGTPLEILLEEAAAWLESLAGRWDLAVNVHGTAEAGAITGATGAPARRGLSIDGGERADPWTEWRASAAAAGWPRPLDATEIFALVAGLEPAACGPPVLVVSDRERAAAEAAWGAGGPRIALQASAATASKSLSAAEAAAIGGALEKIGRVALIGAPVEAAFLEEIGRRAPSIAVRTSPLRESVGLLAAADLVVTVDTWAAHAAAALGRPCLLLLRRMRTVPRGRNPCLALLVDEAVRPDRVAALAGEIVAGGLGAAVEDLRPEERPFALARDGLDLRPIAPRRAPAEARAAALGAGHLIGWEAFVRARWPEEPPSGLDAATLRARLEARFDAASVDAARESAAEAAGRLRAHRERLAGPDAAAALQRAKDSLPADLAEAVSIPATALIRAAPADRVAWLRDAVADLSAGIALGLERLAGL